MDAEGVSTKESWRARIMLAVYRYLPLPVYVLLLLAYWLLPFARRRIGARLAMDLPRPKGSPVYWFHASSVGEMSTIAPIVAEVRQRRGNCEVVVSTMTVNGMRRAREILNTVPIFLLPLDFYPCMRRAVERLKPSALVIGETEIWPNLIVESKRRAVQIALLNGRISKKSFPRYKLARPLIGDVLGRFDRLLMRTRIDADRIIALGAAAGRVEVAGNTKYDMLPGPLPEGRRQATRRDLAVGQGQAVITLGSAREGECEVIFEALRAIPPATRPVLVVAPRHMGLVSQIEELAASFGFTSRTTPSAPGDSPRGRKAEIIIIAEMGRLLDMYAISDIAIVGGTFKSFGGHNPLEPASQGVVTIVGPHIQNIADDMEYLRSRGCAFISDGARLAGLIRDLLSDGEGRIEMGRRAASAVREMKGISRKYVDTLFERGILR
jgi:3-deoxy-D-manno-octulosonic-acid transferase